MNAVPEQMTPEERSHLLKHLATVLAMAPVVLTAPLVDVYVRDSWLWVWPVAIVGPIYLLVWGARAMLFTEVQAARPRAMTYGVAAALLLLAFAPEALRLSIANFSIRPSWIAWMSASAFVAVVYVWFAFRLWWKRRQPPNTSLERTRDR